MSTKFVIKINQLILGINHSKYLITNNNTALCVEGFPRSGNTFFVDYINEVNGYGELKISHHTHSFRNILLAAHLNIPSVVLIRDARDSILSFMIHSNKSVSEVYKKYCDFYKRVNCINGPIAFFDFESIIREPDACIEAINTKFDMTLTSSDDQINVIEKVKLRVTNRAKKQRTNEEYIRTVGAPNKEREKIKKRLAPIVDDYLSSTNMHISLINEIMERKVTI
jgi:hypothetical protein